MLDRLPAWHVRGRVNVVIETPRGSHNKFSFDGEGGVFRLGKQLPAGAVFPFDFGFIPSTLADDGDPLDVLILLDAPTFPGCVVTCRIIGVIDGSQTSRSGQTTDNPRLIAVATKSTEYAEFRRLSDVQDRVIDEITHFFVSYNEAVGKKYRPKGAHGPRRAAAMVEAGVRRHRDAASRARKHRRRLRPVA